MAKDQSSKSLARSTCEKISKATFGTLRRISHSPKNKNVSNPSLSATGPPALHQPTSGDVMPIQSESFRPPPFKKIVRFSSRVVKKTGDGGGKEFGGQKTFSEEGYNTYINHTKMKMRAPSAVSGGRTISRRESFNDMFSSYISRTKQMLRTTTSVDTDGKTMSSK